MKAVVVHRGARDSYQAALALAEAGRLERLVTDIYLGSHSWLVKILRQAGGARAAQWMGAHAFSPVDGRLVSTCSLSGWTSFLLDKLPRAPFLWRSRATRWTDRTLGARAGRIARQTGAALLSYSYYGYSSFRAAGVAVPRILFQLHPHPRSMRAILQRELLDHPDCALSLQKEWELALADDEFARLCEEAAMAGNWIAASSFTRRTLIENGAPAARVQVAPYGVDLTRFHPGDETPGVHRPLRVLFVGTINQRKGIKYLLEAVRRLGTKHIELVIRGRAVDGLELVRKLFPEADVRLSVSHAELLGAYQSADLFVFPSLGEGFGHVLIEALACGVPILSTTHTAAPDLVTEGEQGFVVAPRRTDLLAHRLEWALTHRSELVRMRSAARAQAETFTWERFRSRMRDIVDGFLEPAPAGSSAPSTPVIQHV